MAGGRVDGVAVAGVASAVPEGVRTLDDMEKVFGAEPSRRLAKSTGVARSRVSRDGICASDLCYVAAERLLEGLSWERRSIDLLVFVSVTPDFVTPATACTLQHRLELSKDCAAFDISHACSGYLYGLWVVAHLLGAGSARRALLLVGDTASRFTSPYDRATAPLVGDGGTATAVEWSESAAPMYFEMGSDGGGAPHLQVRAGGFRHPSTAETSRRIDREGGSARSEEELYLNGAEIFAFTLREVPALTRRVLERAAWTMEDVDAVVMHQANLFMMRHLAKKLRIPKEKLVENIEDYGNTSGASIPMALTEKMAGALSHGQQRLVLLGFGAGLSWGGVAMRSGPLVVPELATVRPNDLADGPR